jgi:hypothetical protein
MNDPTSRVVLGYHGCTAAHADRLIRGDLSVADWKASANRYDWLGGGIYFWEYGSHRARAWAKDGVGVVGALIALGRCADFTDLRYIEPVAWEYESVRQGYRERGIKLPSNTGGAHNLDCLVINSFVDKARKTGDGFQTVRAAFLEGDPIFPGSMLLSETHIQIAVLDVSCIVGVFRPNFG